MKDYTKYDFAAIVGAEVEIKTKSGEPVRGTLIDFNFNLAKAPIYIHESSDYVTGVPIAEIESLSAKIKVEDMNVRQLERHFKFDCDTHLVLNTCEANTCRFVNGGLADISAPTALSAKIDCTEWGWKRR